jgi:hypothetical protein
MCLYGRNRRGIPTRTHAIAHIFRKIKLQNYGSRNAPPLLKVFLVETLQLRAEYSSV